MVEPKRENHSDPVYSKNVLEVLTLANEFCLFLEKAESYSREELIGFLQKVFPLIYLKAALLPEIQVEDEEAIEHYVTEEEWESIFSVLRIKFGEDDIFFFIDHHEKSNTDPLRASLSENIADIYQDLKDFLILYQKPLKTFKENAVRDLRYLFETRFGYRIVNSQAALHYLLYKESDNDALD